MGRLGFVRAAQAVGLTLGGILQIIAFRDNGQAPCAHVTDLLQRHAAGLDQRIRELQQLHGELRQLAHRATTPDPRDGSRRIQTDRLDDQTDDLGASDR